MNRLQNLQKNLISNPKSDLHSFKQYFEAGNIQPNEFGRLVFGPNFQSRLQTLNLVKYRPQLYEHYHLTQASRAHQRQKSVDIMFKTHQILNITYEEYIKDTNKLSLISSAIVNYDYGFSVKSGVHFFLYMRALVSLGTQRHQKFFQRASIYSDIGGFALTELTHGSNVKGIQTEAHYDHITKQYIIHSPSQNAMKFWIGALGNVATMAVVWANLILDGKNYGIHAFVTPIRCSKTHKVFPGVIVGDCGPKSGLNAIDNGFILFDNYRIPRQNQLNKISGVDQNGKFFSQIQSQQKRFGLHLGALSGGRFMVSMNCGTIALTALCIAIRYTCVRKQFSKNPKQKSQQDLLIEYPLTKRRMMPLLAQAVVYNIGNFSILKKWDQNYSNMLNSKNSVIDELHFISSALKPKTSWFANECVRQCRQMMGGHGYSSYSKIGVLINDNQVNSTWQGDNNVLLQQTTKICLQNLQRTMKGKPIQIQILKFFQNPSSQQISDFSPQNIRNLVWTKNYLQYRLSSKLQQMIQKMMELKQQNTGLFDIWNQSQPYLGKNIALILGDLYYLETMLIKINEAKNVHNKQVLTNCALLWTLKLYRQDEYADQRFHGLIQSMIIELSESLAKQSLKILACIVADDHVIGSPFADENGNGMQKYLDFLLSINKNVEKPSWYPDFIQREQNKI